MHSLQLLVHTLQRLSVIITGITCIDDPLTLFEAYIVGLAHTGQAGDGAILPATHLNPSQTCSVP